MANNYALILDGTNDYIALDRIVGGSHSEDISDATQHWKLTSSFVRKGADSLIHGLIANSPGRDELIFRAADGLLRLSLSTIDLEWGTGNAATFIAANQLTTLSIEKEAGSASYRLIILNEGVEVYNEVTVAGVNVNTLEFEELFKRRGTGTYSNCDVYGFEYIDYKTPSKSYALDFEATGGAGLTIPDALGSVVSTLTGTATDDSQWLTYDAATANVPLALRGGGVRLTEADSEWFQLPQYTFPASGSFSIEVDLRVPELRALTADIAAPPLFTITTASRVISAVWARSTALQITVEDRNGVLSTGTVGLDSVHQLLPERKIYRLEANATTDALSLYADGELLHTATITAGLLSGIGSEATLVGEDTAIGSNSTDLFADIIINTFNINDERNYSAQAVGSTAISLVDTLGGSPAELQTSVPFVLPIISVNKAPIEVTVGGSLTLPTATVVDTVTGVQTLAPSLPGFDINTIGTYSAVYTYTDTTGNVVVPVTIVINVIDSAAPVISLPQVNYTLAQGTDFIVPTATATLADGSTASVTGVGSFDGNTLGVYTIVYNYTDGDGRAAVPLTVTITIVVSLDITTLPLVRHADLDHVGSFYVNNEYMFGEWFQITFSEDGNSLFIVNYYRTYPDELHRLYIAQFAVPTNWSMPTSISDISQLGAPLQFADNVLGDIVYREDGYQYFEKLGDAWDSWRWGISGVIHKNNKLIINFIDNYDTNLPRSVSAILIEDASNLATTPVSGNYSLDGQIRQQGAMTFVPPEHQELFGGDTFMFATLQSNHIGNALGPCVHAFNFDEVQGSTNENNVVYGDATKAYIRYERDRADAQGNSKMFFDRSVYTPDQIAPLVNHNGESQFFDLIVSKNREVILPNGKKTINNWWNPLSRSVTGLVVPESKSLFVIASAMGVTREPAITLPDTPPKEFFKTIEGQAIDDVNGDPLLEAHRVTQGVQYKYQRMQYDPLTNIYSPILREGGGHAESAGFSPAIYDDRKTIILAFSLEDIAAVKAGTMNAWEIQPYYYDYFEQPVVGTDGLPVFSEPTCGAYNPITHDIILGYRDMVSERALFNVFTLSSTLTSGKPYFTTDVPKTKSIDVGDSLPDFNLQAFANDGTDITANIVTTGDTFDPNTVGKYVQVHNVTHNGVAAKEYTRTLYVAKRFTEGLTLPVVSIDTQWSGSSANNPIDSYVKMVANVPGQIDNVFTYYWEQLSGTRVIDKYVNSPEMRFWVTEPVDLRLTVFDGTNTVTHEFTVTVPSAVAAWESATTSYTILENEAFTAPTLYVNDDVAGRVAVTTTDTIDSSTLSVQTLTYTYTDSSGNVLTPFVITVTVGDNLAPVITVTGSSTTNVTVGGTAPTFTATATDNVDTTINVVESGDVINTQVVGTYVRRFNATDSAGNVATEVTRTVVVAAVTQYTPVITIPQTNYAVTQGNAFTVPSGTVTDSVLGAQTVTPTGSVNTSVVGTYTLTYNYTDSSGGVAATRTATVVVSAEVVVVDDTPVISINPTAYTIAYGATFVPPTATVTSAVDGNSLVNADGSFDVNTAGVYTLTYSYTDGDGNAATPVTITLTVLAENVTPPVVNDGTHVMFTLPEVFVNRVNTWYVMTDLNGKAIKHGQLDTSKRTITIPLVAGDAERHSHVVLFASDLSDINSSNAYVMCDHSVVLG